MQTTPLFSWSRRREEEELKELSGRGNALGVVGGGDSAGRGSMKALLGPRALRRERKKKKQAALQPLGKVEFWEDTGGENLDPRCQFGALDLVKIRYRFALLHGRMPCGC